MQEQQQAEEELKSLTSQRLLETAAGLRAALAMAHTLQDRLTRHLIPPLSTEAALRREEELRNAQLEEWSGDVVARIHRIRQLWDMHFDSEDALRAQGCRIRF